LAHIFGKGQSIQTCTFASHQDLSRSPVNILQFHVGHFPGTQAQASQQEQDCVIAPTRGPVLITAL
jgi:hypothetical protein